MSQMLTELLEQVRKAYIHEMESKGLHYPYLTAYCVAHRELALPGKQLAAVIASDPKLLASRASDLIDDPAEVENPSLGAIITANLVSAAMEGLLLVAINRDWISVDEHGVVQVDAHEQDLITPSRGVDYSETPREFVPPRGRSQLTELFNLAESVFEERLKSEALDAYQLALHVAADHAIFAPDDLAPLVLENPLLLGLRNDQVIDAEMFEGDPPAGMILSAHLTEMLVQQLVDRAIQLGALGHDADGNPIVEGSDDEDPVLH